MNEPSAGRKRARIKGRCLARRAEMKQQGFCLSGCPPLSFPQFTPAGWSPRCMNLAAPFNPFFSTSNSILRHPFGLPSLLRFLSKALLPPFSTLLHPSYTLNLSSPPLPCYTMHVCTPFAHILSHRISSRAIILITSNFEFHLGASIRYSTCSVSRYESSTFPTISSIRYISLPSFVQHPSSSSSSSSRDSFRKPTSYSDLNPIYLYSTF